MANLTIKHLNKKYKADRTILKDLSLEVSDGELVSIIGPSGCGKTTTLRIIAGLLDPTDGEILINNHDVSATPVYKRNLGMVFQSYALFPHLSVFENVAFGLKQQHEDKAIIQNEVSQILQITKLEDFKDSYPKELSGGQQQRVSLARALVVNPDLLLMDEPLSNLDAKLRINMREEIRKLQKKLGITTIFVTHDQEEGFAISDHVAVMNGGKIEQFDSPEQIYNHPKTKFVAEFIGYCNFIKVDGNAVSDEYQYQTTKFKSIYEVKNASYLTIRPDRIQIASGENELKGVITDITYLGSSYRYLVETDFGNIKVDEAGNKRHIGEQITLNLDMNYLVPLVK